MKEMWNTADHGGKHHDPLNGPVTAWVHRLEELGRTVRGDELIPKAQTPKKFQGRERPRFVRPLSRHKPVSFLSSLRGRSRP
jgi:hypothetical protein